VIEHDSFCETCGGRASWVTAEMGPPTRLAFFCEEHIGIASVASRAAVAEAVRAYSAASDGVLAAVWQRVSDRYPDPVRLDADLRARAGIPPGASWDVLRRPPMSANQIGITTRIPTWPRSPLGNDQPFGES
jgi:hypothetical protein